MNSGTCLCGNPRFSDNLRTDPVGGKAVLRAGDDRNATKFHLALRITNATGRFSVAHIGKCHAECTNQNKTQRPDEVEVEPCFRQEFQPQPEIDDQSNRPACQRHGGCVKQRDGQGLGHGVAHQGLCGHVPMVVRAAVGDAQIEGHQHQPGAMRHRREKRPERQTGRMHACQYLRVPAIDQQIDPHRDDQEPRADADLGLPFDKEHQERERQQNGDHGQEMSHRQHRQRLGHRHMATLHQRRRNGQRPAHARVDAVVEARKNDSPPKGCHRCHVTHRLDGRIAEAVGRTIAAFQPDLVAAQTLGEVDVEVLVQRQASVFADIGHHHLPALGVRVELIVPRGIKRVRPVDTLAVAADLDHLRTKGEILAVGMFGTACDAAQLDLAGQLGVHRVGDIVLMHLAQPPAGDIEIFVVQAQVDIGDQRRHGLEPLQQGRQVLCFFGARVDGDGLLGLPFAIVVPPPCEDGPLQVGGVDHHAAETIRLGRVMGGPDFQRHLVVFAQVDGLDVLALAQVPEVDRVAVFVAEQILGDEAALELRRQAPFGTDHVVLRQVPPEIIVLVLLAAIHLVLADDLERLAIHDEDARRAVGAILAATAKARDIDALGAAMNGVGARIAGLGEQLFGFDGLVNLGPQRLFDVDDIDARRPDARNDQVTPFQKCVPGQRRQRGRTGIPAEMVKLVALVGHNNLMDDLAIGVGARLEIDNGDAVRLRAIGAEHHGKCIILDRGLHRQLGRGVECRVWSQVHVVSPLLIEYAPFRGLFLGPAI